MHFHIFNIWVDVRGTTQKDYQTTYIFLDVMTRKEHGIHHKELRWQYYLACTFISLLIGAKRLRERSDWR